MNVWGKTPARVTPNHWNGLVCWNVVFWRAATPNAVFSTAYATHQMVVVFGALKDWHRIWRFRKIPGLLFFGPTCDPCPSPTVGHLGAIPWTVWDGRSYLKRSVFPITGPGHKKELPSSWHSFFLEIIQAMIGGDVFSALRNAQCKEAGIIMVNI